MQLLGCAGKEQPYFRSLVKEWFGDCFMLMPLSLELVATRMSVAGFRFGMKVFPVASTWAKCFQLATPKSSRLRAHGTLAFSHVDLCTPWVSRLTGCILSLKLSSEEACSASSEKSHRRDPPLWSFANARRIYQVSID